MRIVFAFIFAFVQCFLVAQNNKDYPQKDFVLPFEGKNEIIGTFCELRPNHFHGGLDIRTNAQIGRHVLAIADGYVSRINISTTGYGKALYITHKNGYTSVYAHLNDFPEKIKWYIIQNQYLKKTFEIELFPEVDLIQVKQKEMVAYSGNTGGSQGPHLHFEIRDTKTEEPVNPLLFGLFMRDVLPPAIQSVFLYQKDSLAKLQNGHYPNITLNAKLSVFNLKYGTYAFGAFLKDFATSMGYNNGVNYIEILKNNEPFYHCQIERFSFDKNRMFNNYIDYEKYKSNGSKIHKLFIDDGCSFDFWQVSKTDGWFIVSDSVPVVFTLIAKDMYGNKKEKKITIIGNQIKGTLVSSFLSYSRTQTICYRNKENKISLGKDCEVLFPVFSFYSDYKLPYSRNSNSSITIGSPKVPIDKRAEIKWLLTNDQRRNADKYTLCLSNGKAIMGELKDNYLSTKVKELGSYYLTIDTIPPTIKPMSLNKNGYFSFIVNDNLSGISHFDFYINDVWVLLEYEYKNKMIYGKIPNKLDKGKHIIKLIVTDNKQNKTEFLKTIDIP